MAGCSKPSIAVKRPGLVPGRFIHLSGASAMKLHLLFPTLLLAAFAYAAPPDNPDPAQPPSLRGAWRAYVSRSDVIVARTDTRYVFGNMGWALLTPNGPVHQDRYQIHDAKLYLYPNPESVPEGFDPKTSALVATLDVLPDGTVRAFSIPDPTQPDRAIRCEREPSLPDLSPQSLAGSYTIVQRRLGSDDTHEAPYTLTLTDQKTYTLAGKVPQGAPYATGTYDIQGPLLSLTPAAPSQGFWDNPTFFPHGGDLVLDNPEYSVHLIPKSGQSIVVPAKP